MKFRHALIAAGLVACTLTSAVPGAHAAKKPEAKPVAPAAADKPYGDWKKLTKDAEVKKGYFTLYQKRESLYLEIRPDQLDQPVLGIFSLARGIGQDFVLGGLPLNDHLLTFHRSGDHILVMEQNTRFTAPAGSPIERAKDLSIANSVIASLKVESEQDSTKAVLVDFAGFVVSDITDLAEGLRGALGGKSMRFDKERSALAGIKMFPENMEIEALLTYSPSDRTGLSLDAVPDERFIPITVHYSFSKLPEKPMMPRLADDRTGFFLTAQKDFGRDQSENFWRRYVNRWRLEKKDSSAAVSEVVKPITFYLDRTIPVEYRPFVRQGIEGWQKAFEAAGYKNAIVAKDAPDDSTWDPEDVRYSSIRWITSNEPAFGAIGPSRVDPRTGEILDADILFEASFIQGFRNGYRRFIGREAIAEGVSPTLQQLPAFMRQDQRCDATMGLVDNGALMDMTMHLDGLMPPGEPVPLDFVGKAIVWSVMHEVGHSLGLRHNFRSSTSTPVDKLEDVSWTSRNGLISSVMDYPSANISADRSRQGEYYTSTVGTCDIWNIRYGYASSGAGNVDADAAFTRTIADESMQPGHEYATDEDAYPADALDPRTNIWDLGDDPLAFAQHRSAYLASLWKNPKFEERVVGPAGDYTTLRRAMDTLLGQQAIALGLAVKYVGGQIVSRNHRGQPGATDPLTLVPAARQREALDLLGKRAFAANAFEVSPQLLDRMAPDRWSHWGNANFYAGYRLDYDLNGKVFAIQNALIGRLLDPNLLARLREAESRSPDAFRMSEHFDRLTKMLWGEVGAGASPGMKTLDGTSTRRQVQRAYLDRLAAMVVNPPLGAPDDARALARLQLSRIDSRAQRALASTAPMGDYTRAHLLEARARIKRALEAGREADASHGGPSGPPATVTP